jgi:MoxR-like ATPase
VAIIRDLSRSRAVSVAPALRRMQEAMERAIKGKPEVVRLSITCLLARGHLLIEDVPGVGKTTLARALAAVVGGTFRRIQFTSDLLPSDIVGISVYAADKGTFQFKPGPLFANVVVADEINRTTPKTQSCLLEAMNERQVSVDGQTMPVPEPFIVVATENPHEHHGTYPLPESQLDRFLLRIRVGYAAASVERRIIAGEDDLESPDHLPAVVDAAEIRRLQDMVPLVRVDDSVLEYIMGIVAETRRSPFLDLGVSTRGARQLFLAAQARALLDGRDYVLPDDVKTLALPSIAHRVVPGTQADVLGRGRDEAERAIRDIVDRVPVPH